MAKFTDAQLAAFLLELTELSQEHGIKIGGCGCCGSPFLSEITTTEKDGQYYVPMSGDSPDDQEVQWLTDEAIAERRSWYPERPDRYRYFPEYKFHG
jgi:hypothetical protein